VEKTNHVNNPREEMDFGKTTNTNNIITSDLGASTYNQQQKTISIIILAYYIYNQI
jgi:hypothetical protein